MKKLSFDLWDVSGGMQYRSLWRHYYSGTDAVIFVIDSADQPRFGEVKQELEKMAINDQLEKAVWVIVANKQDLPGHASNSDLESILQLKELLQEKRYTVIETIGTKAQSVEDVLKWLEKELK